MAAKTRIGYFVDTSDGSLAVWAYKWLIWGIGTAQIALVGLFVLLPRSWFEQDFLREISEAATAWWPKLASDQAALSSLNPSFAGKFVVFSLVAALLWLISTAILLPILVAALARSGQSPDRTFQNSPKPLLALVFCLLFLLFVLVWPTPFQRFTSSEPVLLYSGLFWIALQVFLVNAVSMSSKFVFGRRAG
ncbi:hypothetical protein [Taklimakanibacter albus]|uniref:Uncharacterized protein n=1 Tax=Taklimakanibacter albus TaxID=2800327 RepID=A0ACC5QY74_9HYPH|nr:hypothetical protein [Aestuariivirga sp. YIM B02566]MBK1865347.1 hypothetical protein [Aestuariivirga sp. YIM B02566]